MELLRRYVWLWVVVGIVLASFIITLIFLLINRCLYRAGTHKIAQLQRKSVYKVESNKYQERNLNVETPPLPPRTQFVAAGSQSYENVAEASNYEEISDLQPDSLKVDEGFLLPPPPYPNPDPGPDLTPGVAVSQSYENLAEENDYEESSPDYVQGVDDQPDYVQGVDDQPDYVQGVDDQPDYVQGVDDQPDYVQGVDDQPDYEQSVDDQPDYVKVEEEANSEEDYDDIGGEDDGDEDYDDVG